MRSPPTLRALALDDEPLVVTTFRRAFRNDLVVTTETCPEAALELLEHAEFDVIFVDYAMPGMTGVAFLDRARRRCPHTPMYLVTAHANTAEVQGAVLRGLATAVIAKPWERKTVLDLLALAAA